MLQNPLVILTRETQDNLPLETRLKAEGFRVLQYPCIQTKPLPFDAAKPAGKNPGDFRAVVFTSRRGVTAAAPLLKNNSLASRLLAVVGKSTAAVLHDQLRRRPDIIAEPPNSQGLAKQLIAVLKEKDNVLHIRGTKSTGIFADLMHLAGVSVTPLIVYENSMPDIRPLPPFEKGIAVFASPSAVKVFFKTNPTVEPPMVYLAIGPTTATYLNEINHGPVVEASAPDPDNLVLKVKEIKEEFYAQ
ncbi:MAG: uroporphyrinogen-III synthase [bacterium]|nr:uroporphyrinogen-III synthase [bacterium]